MANVGVNDGETEDRVASNILVVIRCRPLNEKERKSGSEDMVKIMDEKMIVVKDPGHFADNIMRQKRVRERSYAFDAAFDTSSETKSIYDATTARLVKGVVQGLNATVFAYGPTGTGKTHTMLGSAKDPGIMVRTLRDMYRRIESQRGAGLTIGVSLTYIEIYNENIRDLLVPVSGATCYVYIAAPRCMPANPSLLYCSSPLPLPLPLP